MVIVPVCSGSSDDETVGFDEEHEGPDEVGDVEAKENLDGGSDLEVLERILVFSGGGGAERVEAESLEHPQGQKRNSDHKYYDRQ